MRSSDKLLARKNATDSLTKLYEAAEHCKAMYRKAGLPLPREIELLTTWGEAEAKESEPKRVLLTIQPPFPPVEKGWISLRASDALPITVVPAVLRDQNSVSLTDLFTRLEGLGVGATRGSIENIGTKLDAAGVIERTPEGWRLAAPERATQIAGNRLVGPRELFSQPDLAAHRREAALAYFQEYGRLSRSDLIALLRQSEWVHAPINMYLVKADLEAFQAEKLIRRAKSDDPHHRTWDWELVRKKGQLRLANITAAG